MGARQEAGPAVGRRELAVECSAARCRDGRRSGRASGGDARFVSRAEVMPAHVARAARGQRDELVPDLRGVLEVEAAEAHRLAEPREDLPVGQRLAGRLDDLRAAARPAARCWCWSTPSRPTVRRARARRRAGSSRSDGTHPGRRPARPWPGRGALMKVGQADGRVGRGDPNRLQSAGFEGPEHLDGGEARPVGDRPGGPLPVSLDLGAIVGVVDGAVARQLLGEKAAFATTHRIRLAGQAERPGARLADLAGEQVEVDKPVVLPHPDRALVQAHAVEPEPGPGAAEAGGEVADGLPCDAGLRAPTRQGRLRGGTAGSLRSRSCAR